MGLPTLRHLVAFIATVFALACAGPAMAVDRNESTIAPICHFASGENLGFEDVMARDSGWICDGSDWRADRPVAWLRFDAESWRGEERPAWFFTRIARHESISFAAIDADRTMRVERYSEADGEPFAAGPVFRLALPEIQADTQAIIVRIDKPHNIPLLTEARLTALPDDADWTTVEMMLLPFVVGMLVLPLLFDISFFIVLRERFVLLHAAMVTSMMTYVIFAGGLITVFATLPVAVVAVVGALSWAIGCGMAALFLAAFLEPHAQSRFMRRLTLVTGFWTILLPGFFALQLHATQPVDDLLYFYTFIPTLVVITIAITAALIRGSRSARFIALAWAPIMFASADRLFRGLGIYVGPSSLDQLLYLATGIEAVMISLAVADRFLALRRERDEAVTEALMHEKLSERDPLTGLMNRRALDARFNEFHRAGYATFVVIDLDHFKRVNDTAGHAVGDAVLKVVAKVLDEDPESVAVRLGGEEFFLLLPGEAAEARAEQLRQAIPLRVAREVPELEQLVTASMGMLVAPHSAMPKARFDDVYRRADTLLYDAKEQGRNRIVSEKLRGFKRRLAIERRKTNRRHRSAA